jgi:hypothetical protein
MLQRFVRSAYEALAGLVGITLPGLAEPEPWRWEDPTWDEVWPCG